MESPDMDRSLVNLPRDLKARRQRILAAIAAVDGIPTEALESGVVQRLLRACTTIRPCAERCFDLPTARLIREVCDEAQGA